MLLFMFHLDIFAKYLDLLCSVVRSNNFFLWNLVLSDVVLWENDGHVSVSDLATVALPVILRFSGKNPVHFWPKFRIRQEARKLALGILCIYLTIQNFKLTGRAAGTDDCGYVTP
jgi:hypothetical protein